MLYYDNILNPCTCTHAHTCINTHAYVHMCTHIAQCTTHTHTHSGYTRLLLIITGWFFFNNVYVFLPLYAVSAFLDGKDLCAFLKFPPFLSYFVLGGFDTESLALELCIWCKVSVTATHAHVHICTSCVCMLIVFVYICVCICACVHTLYLVYRHRWLCG